MINTTLKSSTFITLLTSPTKLINFISGQEMGRVFLVELEGRTYKCKFCKTNLALAENVVSRVICYFVCQEIEVNCNWVDVWVILLCMWFGTQ
ncbi:hypothetical protein HanPI659440_Chr15g0614191 [Helianthus annuus]|nr:hypothetical protein HanPI659440_Chr15g0614191 [Helianthus annuus]